MSETKPQENQQELFSDFAAQPSRAERAPSFSRPPKPILISTTLEQLLLAGLILILVFCLVFFLGVLRGRYIAGPQFASRPAAVAPKPAAVPAARAAAAVAVRAAAPVSAAPAAVPARVTVPVAAPAPPPSAANLEAKPYTIQVLTSKKKVHAETETSSLRARGVNAWMMRSGEYYVVCVGNFKNKEEAKKDLSALKIKYPSAYLRRR